MKTLVLIDGHSLAYRMHFALEHTRMSTSKKVPTWAVYGFFNAIFSLLRQVKPDAIAISFDVGRITFRNELYEAYKAHRESMPDGLRTQMALIREGVEKLGIPIYELPGYEADDVIGTLSRQAKEEGLYVQILTGDQDAFQLVEDEKVEVLIPSRTPREGLKTFNSEAVYTKMGVWPNQVIDFKGLKGDTSDNIPGIPGVGDKTAAKLLHDYGTLENLYQHVEGLPKNKLREKLETYKDQAFLSKQLATIDRHAPIQVAIEDCHLVIPDMKALIDFLDSCEFKNFTQQAHVLLAPFLDGTPPSEDEPPRTAGFAESPARSTGPQQISLPGMEPIAEDRGNTTQTLVKPPIVELTEAVAHFRAEHVLVTEDQQLDEVVERIQRAGVFALDLETTGLDVLDSQIVGIAISVSESLKTTVRPAVNILGLKEYPTEFQALALKPEGDLSLHTYYIPVGHEGAEGQIPTDIVLTALEPVLISPQIAKIVHNAKFELNIFETYGIHLQGLIFDTMLASYIQDPDRRHGLKTLGYECFQYHMQEITELIGTGRKQIPFSQVGLIEAAAYAACDTHVTWELAQYFLKNLDEDQWTLYYEIELPLAHVLAQIERQGVCLDTEYLKTLAEKLDEKLQLIEADVYRVAGCEFNLNSPKQVGEVLFEKLQIKPLRKTASKGGYSTDAKVLEMLAGEHEVVEKLLEYRQLFKLKSTYVDNLPGMLNPKTGRLHTSFNQTITATGRLSSSNPNLQNIPIRSELGRLIRQAFIPCEKSWSLLSADYSQIELRLLAHFSEDPFLLEAFRHGEDIHTATAALVFGVPKAEVTKEMRYRAKTVNFGVIYGQSAHGLSQQLKITRAEAQHFITLYFEKYKRVKDYIESVKREAHQTGRVKTIGGRVRDLSAGLKDANRSIREFSERAAFNTPLQGSAADIIKVAMIRLARKLKRENLKAKLLLQVHDEVVLEVPPDEIEAVTEMVRWSMELEQPLRVPLEVDINVGTSWMET